MLEADRSPPPTAVLGLDNVELELPLAGVGSRVLAAFLDSLLLFVVGLMAMFGLVVLTQFVADPSGWIVALWLATMFAIQWGYWAVLEIAGGGRTPGKRILGLRVVSRHGGAASVAQLLIRNLVRVVDLLVGVPMMAVDDGARRLGDRLAGTLVLHERAALAPVMIQRLPSGWGPEQLAVVESLVRRETTLDVEIAQELARRVLRLAAQDDPRFLDGVETNLAPTDRVRAAFGIDGS